VNQTNYVLPNPDPEDVNLVPDPPWPKYGSTDSALLAENELLKLAKVQQRLLPRYAPPVAGYELALAYRPSYLATGDYYDFFPRADGRTGVFVGDGSGHGPSACMLMATMRTILRTHPLMHQTPGATLTFAGSLFRSLIPSDMFMTGVYLLLGPDGEVGWSAAGHHPPLWADRGGELARIDLSTVEVPLGTPTESDVTYQSVGWRLKPGDRLLLFTDGLYESRSRTGESYGRQRLLDYFRSSTVLPVADMVRGLVDAVGDHLRGADFEDDFTVLGVERRC
jgi:sigma-B regulation protein RsbU (phosphoserine phosphatase)